MYGNIPEQFNSIKTMNRKVLFWPFLRSFGSKTKVERAAMLLTACEKGLDEGQTLNIGLVEGTYSVYAADRVKSFLFRFIAVPAKWIRTARQYKLNIYSNKPYKLIWEHG